MMSSQRYLNVVLTVIVVLLAILVFGRRANDSAAPFQLVSPAYASTQASADWVFFPVGNQQVRRLVIWDKTTNTVYDYGSGGSLDNTWVITAPGERIEKQ